MGPGRVITPVTGCLLDNKTMHEKQPKEEYFIRSINMWMSFVPGLIIRMNFQLRVKVWG